MTPEIHDELAQDIWDENKELHKIVRDKLLAASEEFIDFLNIDNIPLIDIVVTGSMANYNWTEYSDIDLHVVVDYSKIDCNEDIPRELFDSKRQIWNRDHEIVIGNHPIEFYVVDSTNTPKGAGTYSLLNEEWIKNPIKKSKIVFDDDLILQKYKDLVYIASYAIESKDVDKMNKVLDRIYRNRKEGLNSEGEYSIENIVFKLLRKYGIIEKLRKATRRQQDKDFSLSIQDLIKG